jgi:hypothetical protein
VEKRKVLKTAGAEKMMLKTVNAEKEGAKDS